MEELPVVVLPPLAVSRSCPSVVALDALANRPPVLVRVSAPSVVELVALPIT